MEDIPPSYHDSTNPSVLKLLPPYLDTACLVNLCLVSRLYHDAFIPHLWGSPASHFVPIAGNISHSVVPGYSRAPPVTGFHNDTVYVALTRFKRILRKARLSTRMLCHTLHLPPALSEIYGGPNATWLKEVLDWLPSLQSLCVSGLPFFDHHSLIAVDRSRQYAVTSNPAPENFQTYPIKLLLADKEPNATSIGLSLFLPHLPNLVYLDLSYTTPARDINVLSALSALQDLQILKLRGIGLKDAEAEVLANAIGIRVRLLDVAENFLTDSAVRGLLQACFLLPSTDPRATTNGRPATGHTDGRGAQGYLRRHFESWPVGLPPSQDFLSLDTIRTADLDKDLLTQLTHPLTGRLAFEDIPHGGITHLYVSGNPGISIEGVRSLLEVGRLHVLDAGNVAGPTAVDLKVLNARSNSRMNTGSGLPVRRSLRGRLRRHKSPASSLNSATTDAVIDEMDDPDDWNDMMFPGPEKLVPVLHEKAGKNLTHLRISHAIITTAFDPNRENEETEKAVGGTPELPGTASAAAEVPASKHHPVEAQGSRSLPAEAPASKHFPVEMPAGPTVFELDPTPAVPRAELPGDIIHFAVTPAVVNVASHEEEAGIKSPIRADGAFAPEPVPVDNRTPVTLDVLPRGDVEAEVTSESPRSALSSCGTGNLQSRSKVTSKPGPTTISWSSRQIQMVDLMNLRPRGVVTKLHPSVLPNLRTLILTGVPTKLPASSMSSLELLKSFIAACAAEAHLALLKAKTDYSLPPGRERLHAEREQARSLFALQTIVLEMAPEQELGSQRDWKHTRQRLNMSKSSSGDMDSEALWSAAENDFSFFGEEGEEHDECGIYEQEPEKYYPRVSFEGKMAVTAEDAAVGDTNRYDTTFGSWSSSVTPHGNVKFGVNRPVSATVRNGTIFQSPRNLPLRRNRRSSNDAQRGPAVPAPLPWEDQRAGQHVRAEMAGSGPHVSPGQTTPTSHPAQPTPHKVAFELPERPAADIDVVAELSRWRKERKAAYEQEVARRKRVDGHAARDSHHARNRDGINSPTPTTGSRPTFANTSTSGSAGRHHRTMSDGNSVSAADTEVYVEGHWKGEIKVIRDNNTNGHGKSRPSGGGGSGGASAGKGKLERHGDVDVYGNYFEGGYLYP